MIENRCFETKTKIIEVKDDKIIYTLKRHNLKYYFTYNEILFGVLQNKSLSPFKTDKRDKRLCFNVAKTDKRKQYKIYAHDLAYACYHNKVRVSEYIQDIENFRKYKKKNNYVIDHIDNCGNNNTRLNLLLKSKKVI